MRCSGVLEEETPRPKWFGLKLVEAIFEGIQAVPTMSLGVRSRKRRLKPETERGPLVPYSTWELPGMHWD